MTYRIEVLPSAQRELRKLDHSIVARLRRAINALSDDPRPSGCKKMSGRKDYWRIRVADYRVVYKIEDDRLVVTIAKAAHRREVYDR